MSTEEQLNASVNNAQPLVVPVAAPLPVSADTAAGEENGPKTELAMKLTENSAPIPINSDIAAPIPAAAADIVPAPAVVIEEEKAPQDDSKPIQMLLDLGQKIDVETLQDLGEHDHKWNYNMTLGDIAQYKVPKMSDPDQKGEYWFAMEGKNTRKVFIQGKVKRLSEIDPKEESFRVSLQFVMYWYITRTEYMDYIIFKSHNNEHMWGPSWYPSISLPNSIELDKHDFFEYPNKGKFPILMVKGLGLGRQLKLDKAMQDSIANRSVVCKAKLEVSGVFCEELEINNFPFDVQPLAINVVAKIDPDDRIKPVFLPAFRRTNFFSFDPRYSVYSEWDLDRFHVEFGDKDIKSKSNVSGMNIRIILKRRWSIYVWRSFVVIAFIDALGLCGYVIETASDRLELLLALLLTLVVAMQELLNEPRLTFLSKYGLCGFMYLVLLTVQATFVEMIDEDLDSLFFWIFLVLFVVMNIIWIIVAIFARKDEVRRSFSDADQLLAHDVSGNARIVSSWKKARRKGKDGRLLSFVSYVKSSSHVAAVSKSAANGNK